MTKCETEQNVFLAQVLQYVLLCVTNCATFPSTAKTVEVKKKREKAIPLRQTLAKATKNGPALLTVLRGFRPPPPSEQEWPSEGVVTACSKGDIWIYFKWVIRVIPQPGFCSRWRGNCELLQAPKAKVNCLWRVGAQQTRPAPQ